MTQGEFTNILETKIRPYVSSLIANAAFAQEKLKYIKDAWDKLHEYLTQFNFDNDTFKDLNVRYRNQIENEIRKKYVC
jgi:oligoribonuclease (3'-5' exoribonuclease)